MSDTTPAISKDSAIAIIGGGFAGICAAIRLLEAGFGNITVYERARGFGGVWRANTYPGAACDVPSRLYSYSFAPKGDWSAAYAAQPEILDYLEQVARSHDVASRLRTGHTLTAARWNASHARWDLRFANGKVASAAALVMATGQLSEPAMPALAGAERFGGALFHSSVWPAKFVPHGKTIVCLGTGASAIQYNPELVRTAKAVHIVQRSPSYILPKPNPPRSGENVSGLGLLRHRFKRWLLRALLDARYGIMRRGSLVAAIAKWQARRHLDRAGLDPATRAAVWPDYEIGCKRVLLSNDYYPALTRDNVHVHCREVVRLERECAVFADGRQVPCDAVICGTGFRSTQFLEKIDVSGVKGVAIHDAWADGARAYRGVLTAGFPNLFLLYGPNTNLGHNSIVYMIEAQVDFLLSCLARAERRGAAALQVRAPAEERDAQWVQERLRRTAWASDCSSWYKNAQGRITNNWAGTAKAYAKRLRRVDERDLIFH
ncbi:NAD(P)/FAD-dependent oxidoreductase [Erythrobacter sp.]|uniref:flavin-containing monooxygenase n=1 Tax=Erythrobacter sp. TaxID=1042 RepID=UPI001B2EC127|nr:NAD(P)/FAD-dependent oxidoreductase [Erythrobacter sp.]MBO6527558.1 NAD(P)/FAD-dependent oxidoreductase [Erythrobacter sp.]MBO6530238.1 NAD(P)/FAD-dependent oxidoreductase [Erythrobacter sp.]